MLKIENTEVVGWEHAIRGMRNPMNSWEKSDSDYRPVLCRRCDDCPTFTNKSWNDCNTCEVKKLTEEHDGFMVGPNDLDLMKRLRNAGTDHRKFMRMIVVYLDITAPLYWWKEFDTYKVGTVANSCSTMHKIAEKEFTQEDFSHEHLFLRDSSGQFLLKDTDVKVGGISLLNLTVNVLNGYRNTYIKENDSDIKKLYWWQMIQLLPSSYNQRRTVMLSYEVLANIYKSRRNHKLDEWHTFCDWIESLPYSELITGNQDVKTVNELRAERGLPPVEESDNPWFLTGMKEFKSVSMPRTFISEHDRLVISAYTGYMMCDFDDIHRFIETMLGRPVLTHELADPNITKQIQEKLEDEWRAICGRTPEEKQ